MMQHKSKGMGVQKSRHEIKGRKQIKDKSFE